MESVEQLVHTLSMVRSLALNFLSLLDFAYNLTGNSFAGQLCYVGSAPTFGMARE